MRRKPKGSRYRNLYTRSDVIYYERVLSGKKIKLSTKTNDWDTAAEFRDRYEAWKGIGRVPFYAGDIPKFREFAERYLAEDTSHLAETTRSDRHSYLRERGPLLAFFRDRPLDEIDAPLIREWWNQEILGSSSRAERTGRAYLDVLSSVLGYAQDLGVLEANPVPAFRETLRRRARSKKGRAEAQSGRHVSPIEGATAILELLKGAREEGLTPFVFVLLCLDAGLRVGEALGLTWGQIIWGADENDTSRALVIDRSRPRGGKESDPKSGRHRRGALSRRLRSALQELCRARFEPSPSALVLNGIDDANFRHRDWRRILKRAGIGHRAMKDLRDTYASWLITFGIPIGYVSRQLGHADIGVTVRHYAKWAAGDEYRVPVALLAGEVPADLLARLGEESHQSPTTKETTDNVISENSRLFGSLLERETGLEPATLSLGNAFWRRSVRSGFVPTSTQIAHDDGPLNTTAGSEAAPLGPIPFGSESRSEAVTWLSACR
jgi:integrase